MKIELSVEETNTCRYALNELADRRQEQAIERGSKACEDEARVLRELSHRFYEANKNSH